MTTTVSGSQDSDVACQFHVVGIGASAGGLEALETLFSYLPGNTGAAFVVVQHLSPDFKSHMEELLRAKTTMSIYRVKDGMQVQPNRVYLIPPRKEMILRHSRFILTDRERDGSLSHPIDKFFCSLAGDVQGHAIGIVLSGTGTDGSEGIHEIHNAGGLVMAQDPHSSGFDGMPLNAQATGIVDAILPAEALANALVQYITEGITASDLQQLQTEAGILQGANRIFQLLHQQHGIDFSHYKSSTINRRIQRRMDLKHLSSLDSYIDSLGHDPHELNDLYKDLLIGVTRFFRDPEAFQVLQRDIVPELFSKKKRADTIRVWVAGCASGEEAYSLAILLDEESRRHVNPPDIKIFATDAHHVSLSTAAKGVFPEDSMSEMSRARRDYYFRHFYEGFHVTPELRKYIVFAPHNLIHDPPFTNMDLVTCRNLLIYLKPLAQKKALSMFHFALRTGGTLFLGPSETPGEISDEFQTVDKRWRIYRKWRNHRLRLDPRLPFIVTPENPIASSQDPIVARAIPPTVPPPRPDVPLLSTYDLLLNRRMPPSILVDQYHNILHIFGGAERFLEPRGGRPSACVTDVIMSDLKPALAGALLQAVQKGEIVRYSGIQIQSKGSPESLRLMVEPITDTGRNVHCLLIEFETSTATAPLAAPVSEDVNVSQLSTDRVASLEAELRSSQESLRTTIEEMETSNEELQSANEELVASNEELQSTNEELHSVNEELYTVNVEHQRRVEELAQANDDMDNLLSTTRVGVIFLDTDLCVRRFTPEIGRILQLIPQDAGRSIEGFLHHLQTNPVMERLHEVVLSKQEVEFEATDRQGTPYLLRMQPYRSNHEIDGVVMTMIDIGTLKAAETSREQFRFMTEASTDPVILAEASGRLVYVNPAAAQLLQRSSADLMARTMMDIVPGIDEAGWSELFQKAEHSRIKPFESELKAADGTLIAVETSISSILIEGRRFLSSHARDITERRQVQHEMRVLHLAIESAMNGVLITDATRPDNPIVYANAGFQKLTGYPLSEITGKNCRFLQGKDTNPESVQLLRTAIQSGQSIRTCLLNYRRDGTSFWNDLQITPITDDRGRVNSFVGIQNDVTQQVDSELASRRNAERLSGILNATAEGIFGIDQDGNCTFCNQTAVLLLGHHSPDDLIGQHMHSLIHQKAADGTSIPGKDCSICLAAIGKQSVHVDHEMFWRKDGTCFPAEYRIQPLQSDGQQVGAVVTFQDISERLNVASEMEQMGTILNASHDAIMVWELDGTIIRWNTGATRLYGYSAQEAIGKVPRELLQTRYAGGWDEVFQALHDSGEWIGTLEQCTRDGRVLAISSRRQLLQNIDGSKHVLEISRDVTQQQQIQHKLEAANRAVLKASKAKSAFLASMSHELRTPMTAVLGFSEMLRNHSDDPEYIEKVDTIRRNGEYLLALLNDILDLSKIEAGKMDIESQPVEVSALVEDLRSLMSVRAIEEGLPLRFEYRSAVPAFIMADRIRVRQILVNLIGNALKFTDSGEVTVSIGVGEDSDQSRKLKIDVRDTGIGMTPQQIRDLFRPFSQATSDTGRRFGGTGLGLSISKRLAEQMDSKITVESQLGTGSCFTVWLPLTDEQLQQLVTLELGARTQESSSDSTLQLPTLTARVLLADDRRDVWRVARYFLEKCGAYAEIAEDGRQAIDAVQRASKAGKPFDLILMDMQMPVMTGQEAVAELRRQGFTLPIIALTADAMDGERDACLAIGCDDYSPKPIDGPALMNLVAKHLQKSCLN